MAGLLQFFKQNGVYFKMNGLGATLIFIVMMSAYAETQPSSFLSLNSQQLGNTAMIGEIKSTFKDFKTASVSQIFNTLMTKIFADDAPMLMQFLGKCKANDPNIIHEINMTNLQSSYDLFHACQKKDPNQIYNKTIMHFLSEVGRAVERCHLNLTAQQVNGTMEALFSGFANIQKFSDDAVKALLQVADDALGKGAKEVQTELRLAAERNMNSGGAKERDVEDLIFTLKHAAKQYVDKYQSLGPEEAHKEFRITAKTDLRDLLDKLDWNLVCEDMASDMINWADTGFFYKELFEEFYNVFHDDRLP